MEDLISSTQQTEKKPDDVHKTPAKYPVIDGGHDGQGENYSSKGDAKEHCGRCMSTACSNWCTIIALTFSDRYQPGD